MSNKESEKIKEQAYKNVHIYVKLSIIICWWATRNICRACTWAHFRVATPSKISTLPTELSRASNGPNNGRYNKENDKLNVKAYTEANWWTKYSNENDYRPTTDSNNNARSNNSENTTNCRSKSPNTKNYATKIRWKSIVKIWISSGLTNKISGTVG